MPLFNLSIETLKDCDCGAAAEAFNRALKRAIADCCDRPGEDRVRKIVLQAELEPIAEDGRCDDIAVCFQVKEVLPSLQTTPLKMSVRTQAGQMTLVFESEEEEAA